MLYPSLDCHPPPSQIHTPWMVSSFPPFSQMLMFCVRVLLFLQIFSLGHSPLGRQVLVVFIILTSGSGSSDTSFLFLFHYFSSGSRSVSKLLAKLSSSAALSSLEFSLFLRLSSFKHELLLLNSSYPLSSLFLSPAVLISTSSFDLISQS